MSNHDVDCEVCGADTRGLMGGHKIGCPTKYPPPNQGYKTEMPGKGIWYRIIARRNAAESWQWASEFIKSYDEACRIYGHQMFDWGFAYEYKLLEIEDSDHLPHILQKYGLK